MTVRTLPSPPPLARSTSHRNALSPSALDRWHPTVRATESSDNSISILEVIGEDWWTGEGVTAKRIAAALRAIGERDVVVNINSPGGDFFEGLAIYNVLREHPGRVTVKILGIAASAASVIAMAGDEVQIARAGFLMIHNCWVCACGDRNALREVADWLEPFDQVANDIFVARSGLPAAEVEKMNDRETWLGGAEAVEKGFADSLLPSDAATEDPAARAEAAPAAAFHKLDTLLARAGVARSERRKLFADLKTGTPRAADDGTPSAAAAPELAQLLDHLRTV